jgi:LysR family transcriptional regulator, nitrogen assimilation regulatory protein
MQGLGLTILPAIAVIGDVDAGGLSAAPLRSPRVNRKVVLAWPTVRPPSAAVRRVTDVLEACMQRAVIEGRWPSATWLA